MVGLYIKRLSTNLKIVILNLFKNLIVLIFKVIRS
jgi:hypothetical protein